MKDCQMLRVTVEYGGKEYTHTRYISHLTYNQSKDIGAMLHAHVASDACDALELALREQKLIQNQNKMDHTFKVGDTVEYLDTYCQDGWGNNKPYTVEEVVKGNQFSHGSDLIRVKEAKGWAYARQLKLVPNQIQLKISSPGFITFGESDPFSNYQYDVKIKEKEMLQHSLIQSDERLIKIANEYGIHKYHGETQKQLRTRILELIGNLPSDLDADILDAARYMATGVIITETPSALPIANGSCGTTSFVASQDPIFSSAAASQTSTQQGQGWYYPDGTYRPIEPVNGQVYDVLVDPAHNGWVSYVWDKFHSRWDASGPPTQGQPGFPPNSGSVFINGVEFEFGVDYDMNGPKSTGLVKCECGSDSVGSPKHSSYCPKYENT